MSLPPPRFADLHLHTRFSDGTYTPEDVAAAARKHGFAAVSVTDHDTVEGCEPAAAACKAAGIEFLTGVELTAEHNGQELHFLGYGIDIHMPAFLAEITKYQSVRQERIREMVTRLNELSLPLQAETVFALANCQSPGRPHVARALVNAGLCGDLDEAFERFLKKNRPAWVPKFKMSASRAIQVIQEAHGVAVLAHPGLTRSDDMIPEIVQAGLDGLECFHAKHTASMSARYLDIARQHHLLVTGGSDCHGLNKGKSLIGTIRLPYEHVEMLKSRVVQRAAISRPTGHSNQS